MTKQTWGAVTVLLVGVVPFADAAERSKAYCARFEAAFSSCSSYCAAYIKKQPEYPGMSRADREKAWMGCVSICIEGKGFTDEDAPACDKYR